MQPSFNHDDMLMKPYLEHHGILGMKWGIRRYQNPDGTLTEEGKKRYQSTLEKQANAEKDKEQKKFAKAIAKGKKVDLPQNEEYEAVKLARKKIDAADKVRDDYWDNEELVTKYAKKAAAAFWEKEGKDWGFENKKQVEDWFLYDDGDQGERNSFDLYLKDTGKEKSYHEAVRAAYKEFDDALDKYADSVIGKHGDAKTTFTIPGARRLDPKTNKFVDAVDSLTVKEKVKRIATLRI